MNTIKILITLLLIFSGAIAQETDPVSLDMKITPETVMPGGRGQFTVSIKIDPDYHIGAGDTMLFNVVPKPMTGLRILPFSLPEAEAEKFGKVYRKRVEVIIPYQVDRDIAVKSIDMRVNITVQPCSEDGEICYPPETHQLTSPIYIEGDIGGISAAAEKSDSITSEGPREGITDRLTNALEQGSILAFLLVFLGGVLASLTPCVYPMIPITIAVIGAQATGGKLRGFILSLFYVLGIALTFTGLGVAAAKTGALFGAYAQHPVVLSVIGLIFFIMGLSLLGVFVMQLPTSIATKLQGRKGKGFLGSFLTGLVAGLVVSPCVSPLLVVILTWVAKSGSVLLGAGLLFSFALGLGVLFIVLGTFSGLIKSLPRSGGWMELIEKGFGLLLLVLALIFIRPVIGLFYYRLGWSALLIFLAVLAGAFGPLAEGSWRSKAGKTLGIFALLLAASLILFGFADKMGFSTATQPEADRSVVISEDVGAGWLSSDEEGFRQAELTGKPILIDFFAEWCTACHELDEKTWTDTGIKELLGQYVLVKLDLTKSSETVRTWQKKYAIVGMPTIILLDSGGKEKRRFEGFKPPQEVKPLLESLL